MERLFLENSNWIKIVQSLLPFTLALSVRNEFCRYLASPNKFLTIAIA